MDGVDLQQPQALDRGDQVVTLRSPPRRLQQPLRRQLQQARLLLSQPGQRD
jgi:hypothetical protein